MKTEFDTAAQQIIKKDLNVTFGSVDVTTSGELAESYKVEGLPTLILLIEDDPIVYEGERQSEAII